MPVRLMNNIMRKVAFWERPGQNPVLAALLTTGLVVAVYSFVGGLVSNVAVLADMLHEIAVTGSFGIGNGGDFLELMKASYQRYKVLILLVTAVSQYLIFVGFTILVFRKWHGRPVKTYFRLRAPSLAGVFLPLAGILCLLPVALFLGEIAVRAFPFMKKLEDVSNVLVQANNPGEWVLVLLVIGLTPAICEEFLFRGYFQNTLTRGIRQPWSYLLSGTVFALIHQNFFGLATLILVGVFLGFVFTRFGSLWSGSLVHCTYNSLLVLMVNRPDLFGWLVDADGLVRLPLVLAGAVGACLIIGLMVRLTRHRSIDSVPPSANQVDGGSNQP